MTTETRYEHVVLLADGTPIIGGTSMKVKELIAERFAWGWSPEELLVNHPDLTLGQIFSALAYSADHQAEIDQALENDLQFVDQMRRHGAGSSLMLRLRQARRS
jgi:uncharacterized protein (DUF433 family)